MQLTLSPATLLNSVISSNSLCVWIIFSVFYILNYIIWKEKQFYFFLSNLDVFYSFFNCSGSNFQNLSSTVSKVGTLAFFLILKEILMTQVFLKYFLFVPQWLFKSPSYECTALTHFYLAAPSCSSDLCFIRNWWDRDSRSHILCVCLCVWMCVLLAME